MALAAGNGSTALVYNMHASVTGTLALTSDEVARALGVPESFFAMRDRVLRDAVDGALYGVAMSERGVGSRLSQLATRYTRTDGGVPSQGLEDLLLRGRPRRRIRRRRAVGRVGCGVAVPGRRLDAGHDGRADLGLARHAGDRQPRRPPGRRRARRRAARRDRGTRRAGRAGHAAVAGRVVRGGVRRSGAGGRGRGGHADQAPRSGAVAGGPGQGGRADAAVSAAREVVRQAARRVDAAPGDPDTNRWVWRAKLLAGQTAMEVAASMLEACGTSATRRGNDLERLYRDARCGSLQPATSDVCADWLGLSALGLDPENQAEVPRW